MHQVVAVALQINALARGVRGDQNAERVIVGRSIEGALEFLAPGLGLNLASIDGYARVGAVSVCDGGAEFAFDVAAGGFPLGEDQQTGGVPGAASRAEGRTHLLTDPIDQPGDPSVGAVSMSI